MPPASIFYLAFQYLIFGFQIINFTRQLLIDIQIQKLRKNQLRRSPEIRFQNSTLPYFRKKWEYMCRRAEINGF